MTDPVSVTVSGSTAAAVALSIEATGSFCGASAPRLSRTCPVYLVAQILPVDGEKDRERASRHGDPGTMLDLAVGLLQGQRVDGDELALAHVITDDGLAVLNDVEACPAPPPLRDDQASRPMATLS